MTWLNSILLSVVTAAISCIASFLVAELAVGWYRVSSFEGGSSYFVVSIALGGLLAGFILGLIVARLVAAGAQPSFLKGLGFALLLVLGINGTVAAVSRVLADVPPTIAGEELMLLVELRWPASQQNSPAMDTVPHRVDLGALSGNTLRVHKAGPLWLEDARREDGRWIVPGAVEVFTERGKRVLTVEPKLGNMHGFLVPLDARPDASYLAWSDWLPSGNAVPTSLNDGMTYRFKVVPRSQPARTEQIGAFEIATHATAFFVGGDMNGQPLMAATATFTALYRGKPIVADNGQPLTEIAAVATLPGQPTALLVYAGATCSLLQDDGTRAQLTPVSKCEYLLQAEPLTNDVVWRKAAQRVRKIQGRIDRESFMHAGTYLFADAIFDAATRSIRQISIGNYAHGFNVGVPPIGIAPDGGSFVRIGFSETERGAPALVVFGTDSVAPYLVDINRVATRYAGDDAIDNAWLTHYYQWQPDANGHHRLAARTDVTPLPFFGVQRVESDGMLLYRLQPAGKAMNDALLAFVTKEFGAVQTPEDLKSYGTETHIGPVLVHIFHNESEHYVSLFVERGQDMSVVTRIANAFDAALARGIHDALFEVTPPPQ